MATLRDYGQLGRHAYYSRVRTFRRFLTLQALLVWQGGFVFYAAFVVPIGTDILGSPAAQGAISQRAAFWLNACGSAWAILALLDILVDRRVRMRLAIWAVAAAALAGQWLLHPRLGEFYDAETLRILDRGEFRRLHVAYLWLATTDWLAGLAYCWRLLADWTRPETP